MPGCVTDGSDQLLDIVLRVFSADVCSVTCARAASAGEHNE
jgi:hypothetical protein